MGVPSAGMVLLPLNTRLAPAELVRIVQAARPTLLFTDRDPGPLADEVPRVVTFEEWDALLDAAAPARARRRGVRGRLSPSCTSRRDDRPAQGRDAQPSQPGRELVPQDAGVRLRPDDVYLAAAPFFHVAGTAPLLSLLWLGGSLVVLPAFDAGTASIRSSGIG